MRAVRFTMCMVVLACGGCAAQGLPPQQPASHQFEVVSAMREPVGYYPGRDILGLVDSAELNAFLQKNQASISDIQSRISGIRDGRLPAGCIGEDQYTCVATLAQKFAIADSYRDEDNLLAEIKYDVNGKRVTGSKFKFVGYVPGVVRGPQAPDLPPMVKFQLTMSREHVSELAAELSDDPTFARTQQEYDATGAYELVAAVTAKTCPTLGKDEVAKWIENTVKPAAKSSRQRIRRGVEEDRISKNIRFCGRLFSFGSMWARRTYNQYGPNVRGGMFVVVE
jgi:hypothetical protein